MGDKTILTGTMISLGHFPSTRMHLTTYCVAEINVMTISQCAAFMPLLSVAACCLFPIAAQKETHIYSEQDAHASDTAGCKH